MKRLNNQGFGHVFLILVLIVAAAAVGSFELVRRAQADKFSNNKSVACVIAAPTVVKAGEPYDVQVYFTNNSGKVYTPAISVHYESFDVSGLATNEDTGNVAIPTLAAKSTALVNTLSGQQWSMSGTDAKSVYTVVDATSAAICNATVSVAEN